MSKYIFRIEIPECKTGPYAKFHKWSEGNSYHDEPWRPSPYKEEKLAPFWYNDKNSRDFRFGFDNLYQLRSWFTETELFNLNRLGYRIRRYKRSELKELVVGDFQVMFKVA